MSRPPVAAPFSRVLIVGCMLMVIALYGLSAPFAAILGRWHVHAASAEATGASLVLTDFRRSSFAITTARPEPHAHGLFHATLQRHRHDPSDETVRSVDAADADDALGNGDAGSATSLISTLIAGAFCGWLLAHGAVASLRWSLATQLRVPSGHTRRLEKPPRA